VSVTFFEMVRILRSLMLKVIKGSFLATLHHTDSEDTLPKEYVSKPDDQELQILNDTMSEPTTLVLERI